MLCINACEQQYKKTGALVLLLLNVCRNSALPVRMAAASSEQSPQCVNIYNQAAARAVVTSPNNK